MGIKAKVNAEYIGTDKDVIYLNAGYVPKLEEGKKYTVIFKDLEGIRSGEQNSKLWAIIQEISNETKHDAWELYINGLEETEVKFVEIHVIPEAFTALSEEFRAVKISGAIKIDGKHYLVCKCFLGSSKFNPQEMTRLIDYFNNELRELHIIYKD